MQPIVIPCPHCGSKLKLRDPKLLGKIGKCPQCETRFPLSDPAAVTLELAEPAMPASTSAPSATPRPATGIQIVVADEASATARLRARRRGDRRGVWTAVAGVIFLAAIGAGWWWIVRRVPEPPVAMMNQIAPDQQKQENLAPTPQPAVANSLPEITSGSAIDLKYIPHGMGMLINLRPAEIWAAAPSGINILDCLGDPFRAWLTAAIEGQCLFQPSEIAEAKLCFYFAAPGEAVETAGVITLAQPMKRSEWIKRFPGERKSDIELPYYVGPKISYLLIDEQTFAYCPSAMVADWQDTIKIPATTREDLLRIVRHSDRFDQLIVICKLSDLRLHSESMVPTNVLGLVGSVLDWCGDEEVTLSWGVRVQPSFRSRAVLLPRTSFDLDQLHQEVAENIRGLPETMLSSVETWNPEMLGAKRILGRLPAMCLAVERATQIQEEEGHAVVETRLPEIAGPNLVLASRLAWRESLREITPDTVVATTAGPIPTTIAERLAKPIDCDFRRTPLHEAIAYISTETGVELELMGDDLKLIGVTQNLPQEFAFEQTPATEVLDRMLTKEGLVVVVHEAENRAVITSAKAATERGQMPLPLTSATPPQR